MIGKLFKMALGNWQVTLGIVGLLIGSHTLAYCQGYSSGREGVLYELRQREADAKVESAKAREKASGEANERAHEFEHEQEILQEVIEDAEASDGNALDAVFGSLQGD